ncbi:MAG: heavy metal-responsive transcriptional regulator [Gemmatimonadota bacterium]|nr:heavy metal-responsive transcriptional regulator [Gemmatimonadota bacterium]
MSSLTIGQVAEQSGVTPDTLRYYERRALLPAPVRSPSGYRQYGQESVRRVQFIRRAQTLGFTLEEIADLLALRHSPGPECAAVEADARSAMARIEHKIAQLARMRDALHNLADACQTRAPTAECPILDALNHSRDSL